MQPYCRHNHVMFGTGALVKRISKIAMEESSSLMTLSISPNIATVSKLPPFFYYLFIFCYLFILSVFLLIYCNFLFLLLQLLLQFYVLIRVLVIIVTVQIIITVFRYHSHDFYFIMFLLLPQYYFNVTVYYLWRNTRDAHQLLHSRFISGHIHECHSSSAVVTAIEVMNATVPLLCH